MKLTITAEHNLTDTVKIIPLDGLNGKVISIWIDGTGIQYQVRYCHNGRGGKEYFYSDELKAINNAYNETQSRKG